MRTRVNAKCAALVYTQEAFAELLDRRERADVEWARAALKLDRLTEPQLRAIEWLIDNIDAVKRA